VRRQDSGAFSIGALTTASEIAEFFAACPEAVGLSEAARLLGSRQIQNVATIGGNICKASPGADLVPPLLCLGARIALSGPLGSREAKIDGFLTGPGRSARDDAEILTSILLPPQHAGSATAFLKIMRRRAEDLSIVSACALVELDGSGERILRCRIALGAVAPFPFLSLKAEEILTGSRLSTQLLHRAAAAARDEAKPISDIRASMEYRRGMIEVLVCRAVLIAVERARGGVENQ
jgi:carbon-monoxide dehydrogenase medium subunit